MEGFTARLLRGRSTDGNGRYLPTLMLWGAHDHLVPRQHQETLAGRIKGARLQIYGGTGHLVLWECPERVAGDVTRFSWGVVQTPVNPAVCLIVPPENWRPLKREPPITNELRDFTYPCSQEAASVVLPHNVHQHSPARLGMFMESSVDRSLGEIYALPRPLCSGCPPYWLTDAATCRVEQLDSGPQRTLK
ncbi:alpha/beta fold hydrolase [Paenarthrobacter nitroguajacolicus]|uniref:alpha/beta fold hydrolase n=1 Tax=Paenarthrobacter nitroguajacolicus TaxID=211146 RepID=UPI003AE38E9A